MARTVMRTDSISLGLSSAANLVAVEKLVPTMPTGAHVLTMIYDGIDSYMGEFKQVILRDDMPQRYGDQSSLDCTQWKKLSAI